MFYHFFDSPWFLLALIGGIAVCIEAGVVVGRWERRRLINAAAAAAAASESSGAGADSQPERARGRTNAEFKLGVVQNAVFGVIALLTAFTFGAASSAYLERSRQVSQQADAIAEVWRRADFVESDVRAAVRAALADYLDAELAFSTSRRDRIGRDEAAVQSEAAQSRLWSAVTRRGHAEDQRGVLSLADSIDRLFQRHYARVYALRSRTPMPMLVIVLFGVGVSSLIVGLSWGGSSPAGVDAAPRRQRSGSGYILFTSMMALTVMVIRDLDQPYSGLIEIDEQNLIDLREDMKPGPATSHLMHPPQRSESTCSSWSSSNSAAVTPPPSAPASASAVA
jgi:hypothetical protein